jgi:hypothetical protein
MTIKEQSESWPSSYHLQDLSLVDLLHALQEVVNLSHANINFSELFKIHSQGPQYIRSTVYLVIHTLCVLHHWMKKIKP